MVRPPGGRHPGLTPPEILVCLRIPKTAGSTMESVFDRCLSDAAFHGHIPAVSTSALLIRSTDAIGELFHQLLARPEEGGSVPCRRACHP